MLRDVSPQVPQYVIKTHGVHRTGILKDVAGILAEAGVSIAATQKVALGTEYAMVLHAFHPDGEGHAEAISDEVRRALGASSEVRVKPLDHARARRRSFLSARVSSRSTRDVDVRERARFFSVTPAPQASLQAYLGLGPVERRLVIECPQRPGLIMAVTQLLGVEGCKIPKMETFTSVRDGVVMFHMEAAVHVPRGHDMDALTSKLRGVQAANKGLELTFDVDKNAITKQGA